ncbi:TolC family protein [Ramlibacter sp. WS9]|uniref:TolC family protein n=1 Tax=Ramlibacter sp. WS9 TaxID=1882741 RepID=UPI0011444422|nr:TolC family protein [Ramlibacter sp. WS9]ROZ78262.1 TolC family protein [Ramlibacter sp. WS9]
MPVFLLRRLCAPAVLAAYLGVPVWAVEPLTLPQAQALAVARSQQLAANNASIAASRHMAVVAGRLPDPVLKLGVENLPVNGPDRLSLSRDFMTMRRIGLSQELPGPHKRQLRAERFEREADRTRAESQLNLATIQRETAIAWIERYYTQQMRELVLRQLQEAELQLQATQSGFGAGRNSQADVFAAQTALVMLEDRLSQVDKQDTNAAWMLNRWLGPDAARSTSGAPPWQSTSLEEGPLNDHILYHPDLAMLRAEVEAAHTEARLAQANKNADWSIEAMYSQRGSAYSNMVSVGVSIPLQWDQKNRQDREVAAKLAMVDEARARYEEMRRHHEAELRTLLNEWKTGKTRVARHQDALVPLAKRRSEASLTEYRSGKGSLAATLLARRDEVDARMQALTVEMETARAWAQLNFLIPDHNPAAQRQEKP